MSSSMCLKYGGRLPFSLKLAVFNFFRNFIYRFHTYIPLYWYTYIPIIGMAISGRTLYYTHTWSTLVEKCWEINFHGWVWWGGWIKGK